MIKCMACQQKIKISQVMITAPIGDVCAPCSKGGWEIYETGKGLGLRQRPVREQRLANERGMYLNLPLFEALHP